MNEIGSLATNLIKNDDVFTFIINTEIAIAMGILGISITIFTVIYSFIENKSNELKNIRRKIATGSSLDPYLYSEQKFGTEYIKRQMKINKKMIWQIYLSGVLLVVLLPSVFIKYCWFFFLQQIFMGLYILFCIWNTIQYINEYRGKKW